MTTYSIQYGADGQTMNADDASAAKATDSPFDENGQGRVEPQIRMGGEASRITYTGTGEASMEDIGQIEAAPVSDMTTAESVVASGRSASGGPRAASMLRPNDIVAVNGMETSVKVAQSMGLIRPAAGGGYEDVAEARQMGRPQQQDLPEHGGNPPSGDTQRPESQFDQLERELTGNYEAETLPDRNVEHLNTAIANSVDAHVIERGIREAVETGEFSDATMGEVASKLGMTETQAKAAAEDMRKAYTQKLSQGLASAGLDDPQLQQEFQQWLSQSNPGEFKAARRALFERSTAKGFSKHLTDWAASLGNTEPERVMEAIKATGNTGRIDNGKAVVAVPGVGEMSWSNAVRQGYVNPFGSPANG